MRIKPQNFCMSDAMPFQQHFEARTEGDIKEAMTDKTAFLDVRSSLRVGDRIAICSYRSIDKRGSNAEGLRGFGYVRVVDISKDAVEMVSEAPPVYIKQDTDQLSAPAAGATLVVKKIFPKDGFNFAVVDAEGIELQRFEKKVEAEAFAGIPKAA